MFVLLEVPREWHTHCQQAQNNTKDVNKKGAVVNSP